MDGDGGELPARGGAVVAFDLGGSVGFRSGQFVLAEKKKKTGPRAVRWPNFILACDFRASFGILVWRSLCVNIGKPI
jgi:hypothetical protein